MLAVLVRFSYKGVYYLWQVLSFGFSLSPWVYHTLREAKASLLRSKGVPALGYLDDSFLCNFLATHGMEPRVPWLAATHATSSAMLVSFCGVFLSLMKCYITPHTLQKSLGIWCDSSTATFRIPQDKLDALTSGSVSFETLRSVAGQAMSMSVAIRPASLYTQSMFDAVASMTKSNRHRVNLRDRAYAEFLGGNSAGGATSPLLRTKAHGSARGTLRRASHRARRMRP